MKCLITKSNFIVKLGGYNSLFPGWFLRIGCWCHDDIMLLRVNHDIKEGELDPAIIALLLCLLPRKDWGWRLWTQYLTAFVLFIIFFLYTAPLHHLLCPVIQSLGRTSFLSTYVHPECGIFQTSIVKLMFKVLLFSCWIKQNKCVIIVICNNNGLCCKACEYICYDVLLSLSDNDQAVPIIIIPVIV